MTGTAGISGKCRIYKHFGEGNGDAVTSSSVGGGAMLIPLYNHTSQHTCGGEQHNGRFYYTRFTRGK